MGKSGGVRPASKTSIEIDFYYKGVRCRERIKKPPTPRNLNWAEKYKATIEMQIAEGTFNYPKTFPDSTKARQFAAMPGDVITLSRYLEDWLKAVKPSLKASTWNGYRKIVRGRLIPAFGSMVLSEIKRKHVKDWATDNDITPKTLGNIIGPLRVALDEAVEDELIEANPLAGWKIRRRVKGKTDDPIDPFTREEQAAIINMATGQGRNQARLMLWTGLRASELVALDWNDVDWIRGTIFISGALTQAADEPEEPKTNAGRREIKLLPEALNALQDQKQYTFLKGEEVFQNPRTGERWTGDQPIRKTWWQPLLKKAGVRYRYPYQCRHTYATMMLMAGESPMWVANQMGHTDWAFTVRTYSRFIPDNMPDAGMKAAGEWSAFGQRAKASD